MSFIDEILSSNEESGAGNRPDLTEAERELSGDTGRPRTDGHGLGEEKPSRQEKEGLNRRTVLAGLGTLAAGGGAIAATQMTGDNQNPTQPSQPDNPPSAGTENQTTTTEQKTETPEPNPSKRVFTPEELEQIEQDSFTLNFVPADPNAEYTDSVLFDDDKYNGEITVEVDVTDAYRQIRLENDFVERPIVQDFVDIVHNKQARQKFIEEETDEEKDFFDYETYTDESLMLEERIEESEFDTLWFWYEMAKTDRITSAQNEHQAQAWQVALQQCEMECGFDTLIWSYQSEGHGLAGAAENMTRKPENTDQQNIYIIETVQSGYPIVEEWNQSPYSKGKGISVHPIKKSYEGRKDDSPIEGMASNNELLDADFDVTDQQLIDEFDELYRTEDSAPFLDYSDRVITPAQISLKSGLTIDIEKEKMTAS